MAQNPIVAALRALDLLKWKTRRNSKRFWKK
jgi:hypothetical protein